MKTTLRILSVLLAAACCSPAWGQQAGYYGDSGSPQYVWVPIVETFSDDDSELSLMSAQDELDDEDFDEFEDFDDDSGSSQKHGASQKNGKHGPRQKGHGGKSGTAQKHGGKSGSAQKHGGGSSQKHGGGSSQKHGLNFDGFGKGKGKGPAMKGKGKHGGAGFWAGVEYTNVYTKKRTLPPLVSTGILPGGTVLYGGEIGDPLQVGARVTAGYWLDNQRSQGLVVRAFGIEGDSNPFAATTGAIEVPFISTQAPPPVGENSVVINGGTGTGTVFADASNDVIAGDVVFRKSLDGGGNYRLDVLAGYQFARIDDDVLLATTSFQPAGPNPPSFQTLDMFDANNVFHGAQLGAMIEVERSMFTIQSALKVGFGNMNQRVNVNGLHSVAAPGTAAPAPATAGGIFAQPSSNIGEHERDVFTWAPEISIKIVQEVRPNIEMSIGYTAMYWSNVALAGDHIDRSINATQFLGGPLLGTSTSPDFAFQDTDFWIQTIDAGFTWRY